VIVQLDTATFQRVLGDELRRLRTQHGWTRRDLNARPQSDISPDALATYEQGIRQCSVVRLAEICLALDEMPSTTDRRNRCGTGETTGHRSSLIDIRVAILIL
jgi:transcriptional regulator with XRE-family HTH domain